MLGSSCWCGNLKFEFAGDPWDSKFCHCHDVRAWIPLAARELIG